MTAKVQLLTQTGIAPAAHVKAVFTKPFRPLTLAEEIWTALGW
ncbi:MAG: hypothetical protein AAGE59_31525 [Cyanobacteria bacterium P01_F01_bin.86]